VERTEGSSADCYFCLAKTEGHNSRCKVTTVYRNIPSALRPVKHYDSLPVRKPPQQWTLHEEELTSTSPEDEPGPSCSNVDFDFPELTVSQSELNRLVTDLNLFENSGRSLGFLSAGMEFVTARC
jgi:hypothetical protein